MPLSIDDWHKRFCQQARWTESLRAHFFSRMDLGRLKRILEVGCGTGAVSASVARELPSAMVTGVDLNIRRLEFARSHDPASAYAAGDGKRLPFPARAFDLVLCHFLLLWIPSPMLALREMARVVRPGGWVIALAEPDHSARIDYPPPLEELGAAQTAALERQGADPAFGRRLADLFATAGLSVEETGILGSQDNHAEPSGEDSELEWKVLKEDIGQAISESDWEKFRQADSGARRCGERVLFVPTFYCSGLRKD
ncbi:MAG: methyltransferase domain-containing protein [Anaerolineales bacterium]